MKKLALCLLVGNLVSGCATQMGKSLAGDYVPKEGFGRGGSKMEYSSHRRSKYNLAGGNDFVGPVLDFGQGVLYWNLAVPLSEGEWVNNEYFTAGVLAKDLAIFAGSMSSISSSSGGGSGSVVDTVVGGGGSSNSSGL